MCEAPAAASTLITRWGCEGYKTRSGTSANGNALPALHLHPVPANVARLYARLPPGGPSKRYRWRCSGALRAPNWVVCGLHTHPYMEHSFGRRWIGVLAASLWAQATLSNAAAVDVHYQDGLLQVKCVSAPLAEVFEKIRVATGMVSILDGETKKIELSVDVPPSGMLEAIRELLDGVNVNYALVGSPRDEQRVTKIYVGEGTRVKSAERARNSGRAGRAAERRGASLGRSAATARSRRGDPSRAAPSTDALGGGATPAPSASDLANGQLGRDNADGPDGENEGEPFGDEIEDSESSDAVIAMPVPGPLAILPPPPTYPRSPFTPGLDAGSASSGGYRQALDAFGRPIRVREQKRQ